MKDITVILNCYKRPEYLKEQHLIIKNYGVVKKVKVGNMVPMITLLGEKVHILN
jgi:hypothetical protein